MIVLRIIHRLSEKDTPFAKNMMCRWMLRMNHKNCKSVLFGMKCTPRNCSFHQVFELHFLSSVIRVCYTNYLFFFLLSTLFTFSPFYFILFYFILLSFGELFIYSLYQILRVCIHSFHLLKTVPAYVAPDLSSTPPPVHSDLVPPTPKLSPSLFPARMSNDFILQNTPLEPHAARPSYLFTPQILDEPMRATRKHLRVPQVRVPSPGMASRQRMSPSSFNCIERVSSFDFNDQIIDSSTPFCL